MESGRLKQLEDLPQPRTVEEVEQLVQRLYQPASPQEYARLDECLKRLQKSDEGFQLADALLKSQNVNVRFFGALTFTIKINRDWHSLDEQSSRELLHTLLSRLLEAVQSGDTSIVIRKLCSSLVAVFVQTGGHWTGCVRHILCCLLLKSVVSQDSVNYSNTDWSNFISGFMSSSQVVTALWFATALVEEVGTLSSESSQMYRHHESALSNIPDMIKLIEYVLLHQHDIGTKAAVEAVKFFQSLLLYVQRAPKTSQDHMDLLRSLVAPIVSLLGSEQLFDTSQELVSDVMINYEKFFTEEHYVLIAEMLTRPGTQSWMTDLLSGNFDQEPMAYGRLLLSYGEARAEELAYGIGSNDQQILHRLVSLTQCAGLAIVEDEIVSQVLDFWSNFVESFVNWDGESTSGNDWDEATKRLQRLEECTRSVIEALMLKIKMPGGNLLREWDRDSKLAFQEMRRDFQHFIASAYALLGSPLFESFVIYTSNSWQQRDWEAVEVGLFCINGVSIAVSDTMKGDDSLSALFASALFTDMTNPEFLVPFKTQQTAVNLVAEYADFFKRQPTNLVPTLNFMFSCLESQALMHTSAKTILALCDVCRTALGQYAMVFAQQYSSFVTSSERDTDVKEKLIGAMAAVAQGLSTDSRTEVNADQQDTLEVLNKLLDPVEADVNEAVASFVTDCESARERGLCAVLCLASMGRALRAPDSTIIVLESNGHAEFQPLGQNGMFTQTRVIRLYTTVLEMFPSDGEIMEAVCNIFRAGLTESSGPFVLPPEAIETIFLTYSHVTSRVGFVLETITRVLRKHSSRSRTEDIDRFALRCLQRASSLIEWEQDGSSNDPEVASSVIDFIQEYIPSYVEILRRSEVDELLSRFLNFTLGCLSNSEILPKQSAAAFWAKMIGDRSQSPETSAKTDEIIRHFGLRLCGVLIRGIGGEASRSELDHLAVPLRKLIFKGGAVKSWLEHALADASFPSKRISASDKQIFLLSIMRLRGEPRTNKVVREFWVQCRGTFA